MNSLVSYTFTHGFIQQLSSLGFTLITNDLIKERGYIQYLIPFSSEFTYIQSKDCHFSCLEFREIHDEVLYLSNQKHKDFSPFFSTPRLQIKDVDHPNSSTEIISLLDEAMPESELQLFLKIRKKYPLWAVVIQCEQLNSFKNSTITSHSFNWNTKQALLLHLGPSSLDLIMVPKPLS